MRNILQISLGLLLVIICSCGDKSTDQSERPKLEIGDLPPALSQIPAVQTFHHQFRLLNSDSSAQYQWQTLATDQAPVGNFSISQDGLFQFQAVDSDFGETYTFRVQVLKEGLISAFYEFSVTISGDEPAVIRIVQQGESVWPGSQVNVSIVKVGGDIEFGSVELHVAYDPSVLAPLSIVLGNGPYECGWEYSTYRFLGDSQFCSPLCDAWILLFALPDINTGPNHPKCTTVADGTELFRITFVTADDSALSCTSTPLQFIWLDCSSNATVHSSQWYDTLIVGSTVVTSDWDGSYPIDQFRVSRSDCDSSYAPSLSGWCERYKIDCNLELFSDQIIFWNGEIQFECK